MKGVVLAGGLGTRLSPLTKITAYNREGSMSFAYLDGRWTDAGTFDSLLRAANLVAKSKAQE